MRLIPGLKGLSYERRRRELDLTTLEERKGRMLSLSMYVTSCSDYHLLWSPPAVILCSSVLPMPRVQITNFSLANKDSLFTHFTSLLPNQRFNTPFAC